MSTSNVSSPRILGRYFVIKKKDLQLWILNIFPNPIDARGCPQRDADLRKIAYNGTAGATSSFDKRHGPMRAFKWQGYRDAPWHTKWNGLPGKVWFKYDEKKWVSKISFGNRRKIGLWDSAKKLSIIASDDCISWVDLLSVDDTQFTSVDQTRTYYIPCGNQGYYRCYGFKIDDQTGGRTEKWAAITNTVMYEKEPGK